MKALRGTVPVRQIHAVSGAGHACVLGVPSGPDCSRDCGPDSGGASREEGSEAVAHVLVQALIVVVVLALMQIAFALHTRNVAISAAGEGARKASLVGANLHDGTQRTQELLDQIPGMTGHAQVTSRLAMRSGVEVVEVRVTTALPVLLTWGPSGSLTVTGHALKEVHDEED